MASSRCRWWARCCQRSRSSWACQRACKSRQVRGRCMQGSSWHAADVAACSQWRHRLPRRRPSSALPPLHSAHPPPLFPLTPLPRGTLPLPPGGGDNAMAALGAGAVHEGTWVLSLGTSGARGRGRVSERTQRCHRQESSMRARQTWHTIAGITVLCRALLCCASAAGTLFGPSGKPILDPSGAAGTGDVSADLRIVALA